jgi:hypothetical protein
MLTARGVPGAPDRRCLLTFAEIGSLSRRRRRLGLIVAAVLDDGNTFPFE